MKFLVVLAVAVVCVAADVAHVKSDEFLAPIVKSDYEIQPHGDYHYAYETGNGIYSHADGVVKHTNTDDAIHEVKGVVRYTAPDDRELSYIANESDFKPFHLPVPPPIPELILRSLQYIADDPAPIEHVFKN